VPGRGDSNANVVQVKASGLASEFKAKPRPTISAVKPSITTDGIDMLKLRI